MRYGILSDIHGNLQALRRAVDELEAAGVDEWLCVGDIIGYGPQPNECVELVAGIGAHAVAGNHELMVLGELSTERTGYLCKDTTPWTRAVLRGDARDYLAQLPAVVTLPGVVMTHAALDSPDRYVRHEPHAREQLALLADRHPEARLLILGHTHDQWVFGGAASTVASPADRVVPVSSQDRFLLNPGAVGQSRAQEPEPRARFMLLDSERRELRMYVSPYDVRACRRMLRQNGLPYECIHQRRSLIPGSRRAKRALWQLRTLTGRQPRAAG